MTQRRDHSGAVAEFLDLAGSDPDLLRSGRIPDPQPAHTPLFRWLASVVGAIEELLRARGGTALRAGIRVFWGVLAAAGILLLVGPVINKPMDFDDVLASAEVADVEWIARDAATDYRVAREDDGTFSTVVTERFTANFVNGPEDRVLRTLVTEVDGKDTGFALLDATVDGAPARTEVKRHPTTTDITVRTPSGEAFAGEREVALSYELHHLARSQADAATGDAVDVWDWPLFAPSWPQATKGLTVSVTLPTELDAALVRQPHAAVGWLLVSGNVWLTPDETAEGSVTYSFDNTDSLPPHSDVWIEFTFADGTFAEPPKTALFWLQTWGPLLPLAALGGLMLFALAARWVVWADSAGDPWFVARDSPPEGLSPLLAADLLGKPRHAELVSALAAAPARGLADATERWLRTVARAGRRAGRLGNLPTVAGWRARWARADQPVAEKLRWAPDSYVRDTFLLAPLAVTLVQWGILRQLSHQVILSAVWWPVAFVLGSTVIAGVTLWAVARPRPLTRAGALATQQLRGIDVFARATRLLERGPLADPLLPYVTLFERPRRAGNAVGVQAARESGDRRVADGWRGEHFLAMPALLAAVAAGALAAGSIVLVSTQPAPYGQAEFLTWPSSEASGTIWTQTEGFEIEAELARDEQGRARLDVTERLTVGFEPGGASVPQFEREWPRERWGQDLGLAVAEVRVDGAAVPFVETAGRHTTKVTTKLGEVLTGDLPVEVRYALASPAVEVRDGGDAAQQVRWTAMHWFWDDTFYSNQANPYDGSEPVRPARVQLTVAPDLAAELRSGGWIGHGDADRMPGESGQGIMPWSAERDMYTDAGRVELIVGSEQAAPDGALIVGLDADAVESRPAPLPGDGEGEPGEPYAVDPALNATLGQYELGLSGDLGATLNFPAGTFSNVVDGAAERYRIAAGAPLALLVGLIVAVLAAAAGVFVAALRGGRAAGLSLALVSFAALPLLAVAQSVVFWWVTGPMPGDSAVVPALVVGSLMMWAAVIAQWVAVVRAGSGAARNGAAEADSRQ
ncbi:putative membrane protein DUF2207 [Mycolicibacterium mucogenicum 261Sha1.1M5]|nr:putative membrane protein DUF2207 [Mycolicibacterium mucogenicum 261Sha1.1M5]